MQCGAMPGAAINMVISAIVIGVIGVVGDKI